MNTNTLRLQGVRSTQLSPTQRLMAAPIRSIPVPGGRYVCRASYRNSDKGEDVPTSISRTVEVVRVEDEFPMTCSSHHLFITF